jgi:hypothetical protein
MGRSGIVGPGAYQEPPYLTGPAITANVARPELSGLDLFGVGDVGENAGDQRVVLRTGQAVVIEGRAQEPATTGNAPSIFSTSRTETLRRRRRNSSRVRGRTPDGTAGALFRI